MNKPRHVSELHVQEELLHHIPQRGGVCELSAEKLKCQRLADDLTPTRGVVALRIRDASDMRLLIIDHFSFGVGGKYLVFE